MLSRRLVVCLDVASGRVVKGVNFVNLREIGDPAELAARYEAAGADEIVFLNIVASADGSAKLMESVTRTAENLFIPLTVGGGVSSVDQASRLLRSGADKVSINTAAVYRPQLLSEAADRFGSQCVVASIDARKDGSGWRVFTNGGRTATDIDAVAWAQQCADLGAGEILLTSIDADGTRSGFDVGLTRAVADSVHIPVVASGGGGNGTHVVDVLVEGRADAALMAGALHDGECTVDEIKTAMGDAGLIVRIAA